MDTKQNGVGGPQISPDLEGVPVRPPPAIEDLAEGCVRFVEQSLGVRLDYRPETLPVLDHYLEQARTSASHRMDALTVVTQMAGAYFGEVIRRRHPSWWRVDGDDPAYWQVELQSVYLAFTPVLFIREALLRGQGEEPGGAGEDHLAADVAALELQEEDREAVAARLAELPAVSEEEYYAPSTRLEVIDIAVDAIRSRRLASGEEADGALEPDDYDHGD